MNTLAESGIDLSGPGLITVNMADVSAEPVEWLWDYRLPLSAFCLIAGDPTAGKSLLAVDLSARISAGKPFPDAPDRPNPAGDVLYVTGEDSLQHTLKPRLSVAGADCSRVHAVQLVRDFREMNDGTLVPEVRGLDLQRDIQLIDDQLGQLPNPRLVILDTLDCFLGGTDSHRTSDVRGVLSPLAGVAEKHRVCIIGIQHLRKQEASNALYRLSGSMAFIGQARATWLCVRDPKDKDLRLFLLLKSNLGPEVDGLSYTIGTWSEVPFLEWDATPVTMTAAEALTPPRGSKSDDSALAAAIEWLQARLADGPAPAKTIVDEAKMAGIANKTLYRAKDELKVKSRKKGMGGWYWSLPESDKIEDGHEGPEHSKATTLTNFEDSQGDHLGDDDQDGQDGHDFVSGALAESVATFDDDIADQLEAEARMDVEREAENGSPPATEG